MTAMNEQGLGEGVSGQSVVTVYLNRGDWKALIEKEVYKQRFQRGESPVAISEKSILRQRPKGATYL